MSSANKDSFASSCSILNFTSFSCLISLARTSMLNKNGESENPCHIPDLRGKVSTFHHWTGC